MLLTARRVVQAGSATDLVLLAFEDVTERRRAAEAVRASELRYRRLFESAKDGILILDPATRQITDANPFMSELLGYSRDELMGRELWEIGLFKDREANRAAFQELRESGLARYEDLPLKTKAGERLEVEVVGNLYREDGQEVIQCNIRDVGARKRAERALREADRHKNEFLAMLAHELRNPLAAISNAAELWSRPGVEADAAAWAADVLRRQVGNLSHLVDDLLDVSRISRGMVQVRKEPVELAPLIARAVAMVRHQIDDRKHELSVSPPDGPVWLDADPTRLEQVFANLLSNAAKYTGPGGRIEIRAEAQGREVAIAFRDTGVGITPEMLPRVFDLFTQVERSSDRTQGGLGIGLTVVRSLVELHGGSVTATSAPGEGSVFTVRLPTIEPPPEGGPGPAASEPAAKPRRILVVDDNPDALQSLARLLEDSGHDVETARDGPSAIEAARAHRPEVVILDIGLPGMDGYEVAARLRGEEPCKDAIIIGLSGYGREDDRRRSRDAGFDHHLTKPVAYDGLLALINGEG